MARNHEELVRSEENGAGFSVKPTRVKKFVISCSGTNSAKRKLTKIKIMENQTHRNVLMEHEMNVDGVRLAETKELHHAIDEETGQAQEILTHSRWIDDKMYAVKTIIFDGEVQEETVDTNLAEDKIETFKQEWEEKWKPTLGLGTSQQSGGSEEYFIQYF